MDDRQILWAVLVIVAGGAFIIGWIAGRFARRINDPGRTSEYTATSTDGASFTAPTLAQAQRMRRDYDARRFASLASIKRDVADRPRSDFEQAATDHAKELFDRGVVDVKDLGPAFEQAAARSALRRDRETTSAASVVPMVTPTRVRPPERPRRVLGRDETGHARIADPSAAIAWQASTTPAPDTSSSTHDSGSTYCAPDTSSSTSFDSGSSSASFDGGGSYCG